MNDAVSLDQLSARLAQRAMPLAPESALFIVLEALEVLGARASVLAPSAVHVSADGAVSLRGAMEPALDETAVLEGVVETLEAVVDPVPTGVIELAVKVRGAQLITRGAMIAELAAMLVPLNRRAARRMVSRCVRESVRAPGTAATASMGADSMAIPAALLTGDDAPAAGAHDTQLDGSTMASALDTSLGGRLPAGWDDGQEDASQRRAKERRNAWLAMAVAAVALAAAVVFLVERVKAAGA